MYSILDDIEMYEQQTPFELSDFIGLTYFLNNLLYKAIQGNLLGKNKMANLLQKEIN